MVFRNGTGIAEITKAFTEKKNNSKLFLSISASHPLPF
jgi:hypothetical protein